MAARQRLIPSRREYNRWVADETLEDFALRYTPASARRWRAGSIANTALGSSSFMALEAIGGLVTLRYGFATAALAIIGTGILIFATALPIALAAARRGVDMDLLTRGAGFGYIGSTITSLIYAAFTFIFFALETTILASALSACFGLPVQVGCLLSAVVVVPMVTLGISFISRFQRATQPVWLLLTILPIAAVLTLHGPATLHAWRDFAGLSRSGSRWLDLGAAASVIAALLAQVGEQVDYLRFLPAPEPGRRWRWWASLLLGGPGWILPGAAKLFAGSLLATVAFNAGASPAAAAQPTVMYQRAFEVLTQDRAAALALATLLIVVAQLKINVTNAYAGSIAWSNFFSRLTQSHPGRVVWVVFNVAIAVLLIELGIYPAIAAVLAGFSVVACAWVGALVSDLVLVRPLGLAPGLTDFKRAHLYDINPVGTGAMAGSVGLGMLALAGALGPEAQAFAPFLALAVSLLACPVLAGLTGGRFYLARKPRRSWAGGAPACRVCGVGFAAADTAYCPAYGGAICSLCCTLDVRCHDACKPHARYATQLTRLVSLVVPHGLRGRLDQALPRFLVQFAAASAVVALLLGSIFLQATGGSTALRVPMAQALWRAFLVLSIVAGVVVWLLTLAGESRRAALEESRRQTALLQEEIAAHRRTDADLHKAKGVAEAANLAKSRFVVGVAHELRTPLNAVLGYAQLLEFDGTIPEGRREAVRTIRRSGEHLARLIEGLLDISKIEAGRIQIERRVVRFEEFLSQIVDMFRLQAEAKGIGFVFERPPVLPTAVRMDETRLRQVLINLLSNAIKFTPRGHVGFTVARRGEVTEFVVSDTGPGIAREDLERIFEPFERLAPSDGRTSSGIGLGLTISKLLTAVMGGEIQVSSRVGEGSRFRVRLLLSTETRAGQAAPSPRVLRGYAGRRRTLVAADDDAVHRALLEETLRPLGFALHAVPDGAGCLRLAAEARAAGSTIDAFLLDVSMRALDGPQMDGWEIARRLRESGWTVPIIVVSAHPEEPGPVVPHDAFLSKPMSIPALHQILGQLLGLNWIEEGTAPAPARSPVRGALGRPALEALALGTDLAELHRLVRIGHVRALAGHVEALRAAAPDDDRLDRLSASVQAFRLDEAERILIELSQAR
jgi:signal transduction histidine kinase/purine-cytosine permease-like protein/CheY-like chemotaxis protein